DCEAGETCLPPSLGADAGLVCQPTDDPPAPLFAPCQRPAACEPGLLCTHSSLAHTCDPMEPGCCLPWCDTTNPACPVDLQCLPWYEDNEAPVGLEHVGVCRDAP